MDFRIRIRIHIRIVNSYPCPLSRPNVDASTPVHALVICNLSANNGSAEFQNVDADAEGYEWSLSLGSHPAAPSDQSIELLEFYD